MKTAIKKVKDELTKKIQTNEQANELLIKTLNNMTIQHLKESIDMMDKKWRGFDKKMTESRQCVYDIEKKVYEERTKQ